MVMTELIIHLEHSESKLLVKLKKSTRAQVQTIRGVVECLRTQPMEICTLMCTSKLLCKRRQ